MRAAPRSVILRHSCWSPAWQGKARLRDAYPLLRSAHDYRLCVFHGRNERGHRRSNPDKAQAVFAAAIKHRPRIRPTIRQRMRVLEQWPVSAQ